MKTQLNSFSPDEQLAERHCSPTAVTVTVLICTCNRPQDLPIAVGSVLRRSQTPLHLLVVDQSDNEASEESIAEWRHDSRLTYLHLAVTGKCHAINTALQSIKTEFVAIIDDDCDVAEDWLDAHLEVFQKYPQVALTYGNVIAAPHNSTEGFIPTYTLEKDVHCPTIWQKWRANGIGANTAFRREAALAIGGFDEEIGPGARFRACMDGDFTVRMLLAGYEVYETAQSRVVHLGFRDWKQGSQLIGNAYYGIGASYIKPLCCGRMSVLPTFFYELICKTLLPSVIATITFQKPTHWRRVLSFAQGTFDGIRTPVDRKTLRYGHPVRKLPGNTALLLWMFCCSNVSLLSL